MISSPGASLLKRKLATSAQLKRREANFGPEHDPTKETCQALKFACVKSGNAAAYLRVAHIYMLISMPTETSTIFGAFQAIWFSLWYRTNAALVG
jgi:hypothetical protein